MYFNWTGDLLVFCSFRPLFLLEHSNASVWKVYYQKSLLGSRYLENPSVSQIWNASASCKRRFTAVRLKFELIVGYLFTSPAFCLIVCLFVFVVFFFLFFLSIIFVYAKTNLETAVSLYGVRNLNSPCRVLSCLSSMVRAIFVCP